MTALTTAPAARVPDEAEFCLVLDDRGRLQGCDDGFARWLGYDGPDRLRGLPFTETLDPGSLAMFEAVQARLRGPDPVATELVHRRADGRRAVGRYRLLPPGLLGPEQGRVLVLGGDAEPGWLRIDEVIGLKREREEQLAEVGSAKEKLEREHNDLRAIAHTIQHDVANTLNAVHLKAYLLARLPAEKVAEAVREVQESCRHIARVVGGFVILADIEQTSIRPGRVDLDAVVGEILPRVRMHWPLVAHRLATRFDGPAPWADPRHVGQIVERLVSNAFQHRDPGRPEVLVELTTTEGPEPGRITLAVADNGRGIPEDRRGSILDPPSAREGQAGGVGLAIVRRLVEANGGAIGLESTAGVGTTFRVTLPAAMA